MQLVRTADCGMALGCRAPLVREPIGEPAADELARIFKAPAGPVRLRLVSLIGGPTGGEVCLRPDRCLRPGHFLASPGWLLENSPVRASEAGTAVGSS